MMVERAGTRCGPLGNGIGLEKHHRGARGATVVDESHWSLPAR